MEQLLNITLESLDLAIAQADTSSRKILQHAYELVRREHHAIQERNQSTRKIDFRPSKTN